MEKVQLKAHYQVLFLGSDHLSKTCDEESELWDLGAQSLGSRSRWCLGPSLAFRFPVMDPRKRRGLSVSSPPGERHPSDVAAESPSFANRPTWASVVSGEWPCLSKPPPVTPRATWEDVKGAQKVLSIGFPVRVQCLWGTPCPPCCAKP